MFTVMVSLRVKPDELQTFVAGIAANSRASLRDEPGCLRFDVHRSVEDPHHFLLYEIYTDDQAFYAAHRHAPHYAAWREILDRCVQPGGHVNTFAAPMFPLDIPELAQIEDL